MHQFLFGYKISSAPGQKDIYHQTNKKSSSDSLEGYAEQSLIRPQHIEKRKLNK
jgi:hypothetical protein